MLLDLTRGGAREVLNERDVPRRLEGREMGATVLDQFGRRRRRHITIVHRASGIGEQRPGVHNHTG